MMKKEIIEKSVQVEYDKSLVFGDGSIQQTYLVEAGKLYKKADDSFYILSFEFNFFGMRTINTIKVMDEGVYIYQLRDISHIKTVLKPKTHSEMIVMYSGLDPARLVTYTRLLEYVIDEDSAVIEMKYRILDGYAQKLCDVTTIINVK